MTRTLQAASLHKSFLFRLTVFLAGMMTAFVALAGDARALIRDEEIETTIRSWSAPIFHAAGLDPGAVAVYIIPETALNAFVSGGQKIFLTSGLLMRSESPGQVKGVIAHETGHIAGGHLARLQEALKYAQLESIIALVLGAGIIAGSGGEAGAAGGAVVMGGQEIAGRNLLKYTRGQEAAADQAAMSYLDRTGQSSKGMEDFMRILAQHEAIYVGRGDPYMRSHPMTRDRVEVIGNHVANSRWSDVPEPPQSVLAHARMRAKLLAFLEPLDRTLKEYPESDTSLPARYAQAIAYYRKGNLARALPLVGGLIAEHPDDPYFHELRGQMLFENGHLAEAVQSYKVAVGLKPDSALLLTMLAQAQLELNDPAQTRAATAHLIEAVKLEKDNAGSWNFLAIAYGRQGQVGLSSLALAEKFLIHGKNKDARAQAKRAEKALPHGSPSWLRAQDIITVAKK
ncbi:MAG TPA: peptidase [Rhodospirillaceae bacterium]|jgi:predicted Zn-dependent protease|nr:peptidase [Rhodospirillaceae bacterium]